MNRRPASPIDGFDWPLFFRTLPFQPVPVWLVCALFIKPLARATPSMLRATCTGAVRQGLVNLAIVAYANVLPATAATAAYLLVGRRRLDAPHHRQIGDVCLALVLVVSALNASMMARTISSAWPTIGPGLGALRAACWK
jgi:hypothetical protein